MKRRPEQQSMLTLMGLQERPGEAYARLAHVVPGTDRVDEEGNVLNVTVCSEPQESCECGSEDPFWDQAAPEGVDDGVETQK